MEIRDIFEKQRSFFKTGKTLSVDERIIQLKKLKLSIQKHEKEVLDALRADLGKPEFEGYASEVGFVLDSISHGIKHIKKWAKDKKVRSPIHQPFTKSWIHYEPYGVTLIIGPFNYPFQLLMEPLVGALISGNTAILKTSKHTPQTEIAITKIIKDAFNEEYVTVVSGGREEITELIHLPLDYIFFTGSVSVGKVIMKAAAENLVPVTLELGGKSPTIVHEDANITIAAKRIAWGKYMNSGQTCIAPDYVYVHEKVKDKFLEEIKKNIAEFYGKDPHLSVDYGRIVNEREFTRLVDLIDEKKVFSGGRNDVGTLYIEPTVMTEVTWEDEVMSDEIFGPILPVMTYSNLSDTIDEILKYTKPLATYVFTESKEVYNTVISRIPFGGGCINDTISHITSHDLPFGGVGTSGIGAYHGKESFYTFSHAKSIMKKSTKFDIKVVFPPYKDKVKLIRMLMK